MPRFLVQASFNREGIAALIASPQNRATAIQQMVEGVGGKLESFDYAFGDYDMVAIAEFPDNITMAAISMAVLAGGAAKDIKTTPLLPVDEAMEAMRKAGSVSYRPPGSQGRRPNSLPAENGGGASCPARRQG